jgi:hypothetical protein
MKKTISYNKAEKSLCVFYNFNDEHIRTLIVIYENGKECEFEKRDPMIDEDVDGNEISWAICDELVEMGLLNEDEESFDVFYEMTNDGIELVYELINK